MARYEYNAAPILLSLAAASFAWGAWDAYSLMVLEGVDLGQLSEMEQQRLMRDVALQLLVPVTLATLRLFIRRKTGVWLTDEEKVPGDWSEDADGTVRLNGVPVRNPD